jgi:hypothetical protein
VRGAKVISRERMPGPFPLFYAIFREASEMFKGCIHESLFAPETMKTVAADRSFDIGSEACKTVLDSNSVIESTQTS